MKRIIKTVILAVVFALIGRFLAIDGFGVTENIGIWMFYFACLPFGWRWASKVFTAMSFWGIVIKAIFSILLGMIALPVVVIGDIAALVKEKKDGKAMEQGK